MRLERFETPSQNKHRHRQNIMHKPVTSCAIITPTITPDSLIPSRNYFGTLVEPFVWRPACCRQADHSPSQLVLLHGKNLKCCNTESIDRWVWGLRGLKTWGSLYPKSAKRHIDTKCCGFEGLRYPQLQALHAETPESLHQPWCQKTEVPFVGSRVFSGIES